jgi:hypothetical protein
MDGAPTVFSERSTASLKEWKIGILAAGMVLLGLGMGAQGSLINVVIAGVVPLKTNRLGQLVACELLMRSQNFAVSP